MPNVCLLGNHDLEDPRGADAWTAVHAPRNFHFACANTRFVAIDGVSGQVGERDTAGSSVEALRFLDETLAATTKPHRVLLMHAPPHLDGHYAPRSPSAASARASGVPPRRRRPVPATSRR